MKGQMIFEFVVAAMIFFGVLFYIISLLNDNVRTFSTDSFEDSMHTKVLQISEHVLHSKGNWDGVEPDIGLAKHWPVLSYEKIEKFSSYCDENYHSLVEMLGLVETYYAIGTLRHNIKIEIDDNGNVILNCGPDKIPKRYFSVRRFAVSENNTILKIDFKIW
jgi:hypothetical protein